MIARKKYDYFGIEIGMWNRDNVVNKIECDCGQLANKVRGKHEFFECADCGRCYYKELGEYVPLENSNKG